MFNIRKATPADAEALLELYHGHLTTRPPQELQDINQWREKIARFAANPLYHLLVGEASGRVISSVTLVVVENLTNNQRPYGVVENVVTHKGSAGQGYATALMDKATEIASLHGCYKIMLMTSSKTPRTLGFYKDCGYDMDEKTAFIKRL
ncbi:MAG: GNAT family N-acetyltransferase [Defluviitaleaceae bacterium]|nr:GNAT family N-acetyltransferase [Defluviitaleaceae bacterium]